MEKDLKYITSNMRGYRARKGLSQRQTADLLGISRATYCDCEVNPEKVKIMRFYSLSKLFNCELKDFFVETKETENVGK